MDTIARGRAEIDRLDEQICSLLQQRQVVSREVQQLRRSAGLPGVQHAREGEIVKRYLEALGRPGVVIAMKVLEICRGHG